MDAEVDQILEMMRIIDSTDEVGDCLIWNGATSKLGYPIYKKYGCGCKLVRREMYALNGGVLEPRVPIDVKCDERLCVNPAHLVKSTVGKIAKKAAAKGAFSSNERSRKIAEARRKVSSKMTLEKAMEIRYSTETGPVLSERYGVDKSLVNAIKAGKIWKDYRNPFAQLML